jgi:hypothetical protein
LAREEERGGERRRLRREEEEEGEGEQEEEEEEERVAEQNGFDGVSESVPSRTMIRGCNQHAAAVQDDVCVRGEGDNKSRGRI